ncbi:hypothetical protein M9Y10_000848 [Tritrichomonas musculus]|uniref:Protein kinase domain-containing protein n=1 Tax=Tritrichomonas musculus TaxID=1915356 RepID=A0ABR2L5C3_9EUKA
MTNPDFPDLPGFTYVEDLQDGFLGRTAILQKLSFNDHTKLVCKCIDCQRLGNKEQQNKFIDTLKSISLIRSIHFLPYSEVIVRDNHIFLIRPYLELSTLEELVLNDENPNMNEYFVLWKTIVHAFRNIHAMDIAPCFIRPNNIFISANGKPIITDIYPPIFDAARPQSSKDLIFLAPEFLQGSKQIGKPADVWSLGLLLLFMITGEVPWDIHNLIRMMRNMMKGYEGISIEIPEQLKPIIEATVIVDPDKRVPITTLSTFDPKVSDIVRGGNKIKPKINVQQSVLMKNSIVSQPKTKLHKGNINQRQSLATIPSVPSFLRESFASGLT